MRALKLFVLAFIVFTMSYCGKKVSVTFTPPKTGVYLTIDTTSFVGSRANDTIINLKNLDSIAKENKTSISQLTELTLKKVTLTISTPANGNFDAMDSIKIVISSPTLPGVEVVLAELSALPAGTSTYDVPNPSNTNLLDIFKQKQMKLYGKIKTNKAITVKQVIKVEIETQAKANPLSKS